MGSKDLRGLIDGIANWYQKTKEEINKPETSKAMFGKKTIERVLGGYEIGDWM